MTLLEWLRKSPQPAKLEVGGKKVSVPAGRRRWSQLAETIESMASVGDKLVALDAQGEVLRSVVYDGEGGTDTAEANEASKGEGGELAALARIITTSNDQAVARYESMHRETFATLTQLVQAFSGSMASFQNAWSQQVVETAKLQALLVQVTHERDAALSGEAEAGAFEGIVGPVVRQMMGGMGPAPVPANTNGTGAGKANGKKGAH
jgi:hypothetical protein